MDEGDIGTWPTDRIRDWLIAGARDWTAFSGNAWRAFLPLIFSVTVELPPQFGSWFRLQDGRTQMRLRHALAEAVGAWHPVEDASTHREWNLLLRLAVECDAAGIIPHLRAKVLGGKLGQPRSDHARDTAHAAVRTLDAFGTLTETRALVSDLFHAPNTMPTLLPMLFVTMLRALPDDAIGDAFPEAVERLYRRTEDGCEHVDAALLAWNLVARVKLPWMARHLRHLAEPTSANTWFLTSLVQPTGAPLGFAYLEMDASEHRGRGATCMVLRAGDAKRPAAWLHLLLPAEGPSYRFDSMIREAFRKQAARPSVRELISRVADPKIVSLMEEWSKRKKAAA